MSNALDDVIDALESLSDSISAHVTHKKTFLAHHGSGPYPVITGSDLQEQVRSIISYLQESSAHVDAEEEQLSSIKSEIELVKNSLIPLLPQQPQSAVSAFLDSLSQIRRNIERLLPDPEPKVILASLRSQRARISNLESQLNELEPRTHSLDAMLSRIESAHETADQLPADLQLLAEKRAVVERMASEAEAERIKIAATVELLDQHKDRIGDFANRAEQTLKACEEAYRASTSVGLAAAFSERATQLSKSVWLWTACLIAALIAAVVLGLSQMSRLAGLIENPSISTSVIVLHFLTSILSVGAPVWMAWLATKQIGQRFRLSEDYAFKASISRAYEGYRQEAARISEDLEEQLLSSALTRLDELPLRLVETPAHGSPWHELAESSHVQDALKAIPEFANEVKDLAVRKLGMKSVRQDKPGIDKESSSTPEGTAG